MKTIRFIFLAVMVTAFLSLAFCVNALPIEFNTDGDNEVFSYGNNISDALVKDGVLSFSTTSNDPQLYFLSPYDIAAKTGGITNADKVKQIEIRFASTAASGTFEIFFTSINPEDGSYFCKPLNSSDTSAQSYVNNASYVNYSGTGSLDKFITLTIDQSSRAYWRGIVNHLRIDPGKTPNAQVVIDYIRFIGEDIEGDGSTQVKPDFIVNEEKLYGECLFYDDFESYEENDVPTKVFYSLIDDTSIKKADQCGEIKVVSGMGSNSTKVLQLTGNGTTYKYPFVRVYYPLDKKGQYTMLADMYASPAGNFYWNFFNGYSGTGSQPDKRIMTNQFGTKNTWCQFSQGYDTGTIDGFTSMTYFGFGANGIANGETMYIDNIRVYYRDCYNVTIAGTEGTTGTAPELRFAPNSTFTFPKNPFTRENYSFAGWSTSVNSLIYYPGDTMQLGNITSFTITAVWKRSTVPQKTQQILDEEKIYGECLFFDDFESYVENEVPMTVYYSQLGETTLKKADQCGEIRVVQGMGSNSTKVLQLTGNGTTYKYPFVRAAYVLDKQGKYTMLADMYTEAPATRYSFFNGYSGTGGQADKRIMFNELVFNATWQRVESGYFTTDTPGLTSINYFGFGATNVGDKETLYIDNIRVYYKESYEASFIAGENATGESPVLKFASYDTITLPKNTFTREGYVFAGWKTSLGTRIYPEEARVEVGSARELTLTAMWTRFIPQLVRKNSLRSTPSDAQGIRFAGYVSEENKAYAEEIGFIVTTERLLGDKELCFGSKNENGVGFTNDGVKYLYGTNYSKTENKDIIYATSGNVFGSDVWKDVEGSFFASVFTGIHESCYNEKIVARPYALIDGVYVYGEAINKSVAEIAESAYNDGSRDEYVMKILERTGINPCKTVCFFGDSITHDGKFIRELAQLYLNTDKDVPRYEFYNCGISGDTAAGGIRRLDEDLLSYNPDIVIMMFGMNDIGRNYYIKSEYNDEMEEKRRQQLDKYKLNMETIIDRLLEEGIEVILCTPTPFDDTQITTNDSNIGLAQCAEFVRETAKEKNLQVIDHYANMYPIRSAKYWGSDSVHPNILGHHVMAQSIMYSLGYIQQMDITTPMSVFDELNERRHTLSYDYRMVLMVEYNLINSGYTAPDVKKEQAAILRDKQTNATWRDIYQLYIDNIDNALQMREELIDLTVEMSYKD